VKLSFKIIIAFIAGFIALGSLLHFEIFSNDYFSERQKVSEQINAIETAEKALNYHVLQSGFFLYFNQDEIIHKIDSVERSIIALSTNHHVQNHHLNTVQKLELYRIAFEKKTDGIYDFQIANSAIKNATMAITALKKEAIRVFDTSNAEERLFLQEFTSMGGSVLLAKNSLDLGMIEHLDKGIHTLSSHRFNNPKKQQVCTSLIQNLRVFRTFFPQYKESIEQIESSSTQKALQELRQSFFDEDQTELSIVKYFSYLLIVLYISSLGLIIYFLIRSEKELLTDRLTGLGNRKAYEVCIRRTTPSALFLININKFKNYNDFYGIAAGDNILTLTAHRLRELCKSWTNPMLYRLGGDEFGILINTDEENNLETLGQTLLHEFHKKAIIIEGIETSLSVTLAISTQFPLLETADMALKSIKKDRVKDMILYHEGLNLLQVVQENITKTHELRTAVEKDQLIPHFQPIISLLTGEIEKYESLARLVMEDGEIKSISGYLDVVKESKYYPTLTRIMVQKSIEIMQSQPYEFSINLSIEDIADPTTVEMIKTTLDQNRDITKRIIFEILESEAMHDRSNVVDFIRMVKEYGCKIAIDDFGSGYSNFDYLLALDIDIIKIDGSLIQHIDSSPHALMIVETIVSFAKKAGKKTVAEFVCNTSVYEIVKNLGIDYSQGYFTGRPEAL